jgi:uncharacterized protein involved in exopolysaccharide biosynthesis
VILIFGGLISIGVGLRLGFPPAQFAARSRIKIEQDLNATNTYSAEFMHNEFELIQSDVILAKVVEVLGLPHKWSQRTGKRLDAGKTLAMLKTQLELRPVRCTSLVEIHITSNDPAEAAEISNAVAEEYRNHRPTGGSSPISAELVDTATPPKRSVTPNRVRALGWLGLGTTLAISGICVFARRGTN